jgi:hypothetical protein
MAYKMVVSREGYNALTETNPHRLYFSSDYLTLKYSYPIQTKQVTLTVPPLSYTYTVDNIYHGLGFYPFYTVYIKGSFYDEIKPNFIAEETDDYGDVALFFASVYTDTNYLRLFIYGINLNYVSVSDTFTFYVKLYKNKVEL